MRILIALVVVVITSGLAWLWFEHRPEPARGETAQSQADPQAESVVAIPNATPREAGMAAAVAETAVLDGSNGVAATAESRGRRSDPVLERRLAQNEEFVDARQKFVRLTLSFTYPDLARALELKSESADRLLDVLADHRVRHRTEDESAARTGAQELAEQEREYALNHAVEAAIGQSKMERYTEYMASLPERYEIRELQSLLMNSPDPLEFDDAEAAIQAMYEERSHIERELIAIHGEPEESDTRRLSFVVDGKKIAALDARSDSRIFAAAARHLSPAQAQAFRHSLDASAEWLRLEEEMRRMRSEATSKAR